MRDSWNFKIGGANYLKFFLSAPEQKSRAMSEEEKDMIIKELQEQIDELRIVNHKFSKRNIVLENNLEEVKKNLAIAEAVKVEEAVYKPSDYEIYQTAISDRFETLKKNEEKLNRTKVNKTTEYVFVGQQR